MDHIYEIITTMSDSSKLSLLFKQTHLKELGDRINDVHPLKFLASIFSVPHLKSCMGLIWHDYFKRTGFLDGLAPSLSREADQGKLQALLPDFASELNLTVENIQTFFDSRDWENLVLYLIQT